jgi:hypothetical protein
MTEPFRAMFEALKQTADGLIQANEGIKKMADSALLARDEHEDLRETVHRLETLVLAQTGDLRALRDEMRKSTPPTNGDAS